MVTIPEHLIGDGPCQRCDKDNIKWYTANVFWNTVVGGEGYTGRDPGGIYCITCFVILADEEGWDVTSWLLVPQWRWAKK
jgi:hypothetical protein